MSKNTRLILVLITTLIGACAAVSVPQGPTPPAKPDSTPQEIQRAKEELRRAQEQAERQRQLERAKGTR
jgi:hypothetical protein